MKNISEIPLQDGETARAQFGDVLLIFRENETLVAGDPEDVKKFMDKRAYKITSFPESLGKNKNQ